MANSFIERLAQGPLICDGAMGTQLYRRGIRELPLDVANLTAPDEVRGVHLEYLAAGAELIQTNTFGLSSLRKGVSEFETKREEIARAAVKVAIEARRLHGQQVWVAGSIGPVGRDAVQIGPLDSGLIAQSFAEQATWLMDAGVDLLVLETFTSLGELQLAIAAIRGIADLPLVAQLTFAEDGLTPAGDTPEDVAVALNGSGVASFGANCSVGPEVVRRALERMAPFTGVPLSAQPNAGLPEYVEGKLRYSAGPDYFFDNASQMAIAGASLLGGCCGTTPEHISQIRNALRDLTLPTRSFRTISVPDRPAATEFPPRAERASEMTGLETRLKAGQFIVTMELAPPRGFDITQTLEKLRPVVGSLDAINVADSPRAQGRMSALATSSLIQTKLGVETILHMAIRHRNLLALHSDLLGAHALGVRNVFTVMGDVPMTGDYPQATSLADTTASGLIRLISGFNQGVDGNGHSIDQPTSFLVGAAFNFAAADLDRELRVLDRKVAAGANFLLSQPVYTPGQIDRVVTRLGGFPLPVIMGILPLRSVRHARFLHHEVPGISVPLEIFDRLNESGEDVAAEGIAISRDLLIQARQWVQGAYFIPPFGRYQVVTETLTGMDLG